MTPECPWPKTSIIKSSYLRGRIGWQGLRASEFIEEGPFLVTGTDFTGGKVRWDSCYRITEERYAEAEYIHIKDNDVLITKDGTIGKIALVSDCPTKAVLNSGIFLLRCHDGTYDHRFMFHLLNSHIFRKFLEDNLAGSTINHLYQNIFEKFRFPIPDIEEQRQMATILSTLDRAIEQTESIIAKQQRIKAGLMQDLLTKGIDEHGVIRSEATHQFKDSPLGRIPVEWKIGPLGKVASLVTSGSRGWARFYSTEGAVFLRIGNLTREHINFRFDDVMYVNVPESSEGKRTAVQEGDLLISITADLGIIAVVPEGFPEAYVNQHIALVRLNKDEVYPRFIGHLLNSGVGQTQIEKLNESGAKAGLNLPTIENLRVFRPTYSEQQKIVDILDGVDSQITIDKKRVDKLRRQKTGLMHDLLTGTVRMGIDTTN